MGANKFGKKKKNNVLELVHLCSGWVGSKAALGALCPHFPAPSLILAAPHPLSWRPPIPYPGGPPSFIPVSLAHRPLLPHGFEGDSPELLVPTPSPHPGRSRRSPWQRSPDPRG